MIRDVEIRCARPDELESLERHLPLSPPSQHRFLIDQQTQGLVTYLVVWHGSIPVGHGLVHWPGPRDPGVARMLPNCPEIFSLDVAEAMRSRGLGTKLIARLEGVVRMRSTRPNLQVGLGVAFTNPRARELYGRLGYRSAGLDPYVDRRQWLDDSGRWHEERDLCEFLVKDL